MSELQSASKSLQSLLAPITRLDQELEAREEKLQEELLAVREERRRLRGVLRAADPQAPKPGPRNGGLRRSETRSAPYTISEGKVEEVRQIIASRFAEGEFRSGQVLDHFEGNGSEQTRRDAVSKSLARLRERGQVRLVKVMRGRGGGNIFVATAKIGEPSSTAPNNTVRP
jgi:hypothetical protein